MAWWHFTIAAPDRETRFTKPERLLAAVRAVARAAGGVALLFCVVDDHLHVVCEGSREQVGRVAGALSQALSKGPGGQAFEPARILAVNGRAHLENLVPYVLSQPSHHRLGVHPAAWEGSCLADLVGARILEGFDPGRLALALPRREIEAMALVAVGLGAETLDEHAPCIGDLGSAAVWRAAGAAVGSLAPRRHVSLEVDARAVYVRLVREAGLDPRAAREVAALSWDSWDRLARREPDPRVLRAIRRRLALDLRVAEATTSVWPRHALAPSHPAM